MNFRYRLNSILGNLLKYFYVLRIWLFDPSDTIEQKQRSRVTLLSIYMLLITINILSGVIVLQDSIGSSVIGMYSAGILLASGYVLSRTRYYMIAIVLGIVAPALPSLAIVVTGASVDLILRGLIWLIIPLLLTSLLLSLRANLIIAFIYIAFVIIIAQVGNMDRMILSNFFAYMFLVFFFVIAIAVIRKRDNARNERHLRELENYNAQLTSANKELQAFSYAVSHDIRTPLRSIDGFSQALIDEYSDILDDQGKSYLTRARNASQRLGDLCDGLLELTSLTTVEVKKENVDVTALVNQIVTKLQLEQPDRQIDIIVQSNIRAKADSKLLKMAFENLLDNAWKFTDKVEQPKIEVGITQNGSGKTYFVRDNGIGFDKVYASRLFSAFERLHTSNGFSGIGIGLALVQRIVHRHGGNVWADSSIGEGTTFYFTLS